MRPVHSEIPQELLRLSRKGEVHVNMEDHRHEEYVPPPKPKLQAFSGTGHKLGRLVSPVHFSSSSSLVIIHSSTVFCARTFYSLTCKNSSYYLSCLPLFFRSIVSDVGLFLSLFHFLVLCSFFGPFCSLDHNLYLIFV